MKRTKHMKRMVSLLLALVMLVAEFATPMVYATSGTDSTSELEALDRIDLSGKEVGLLTNTSMTNYLTWGKSENASVSVKEEDGEKYINVYDNDAKLAPAFQRTGLDISSGVKTIAFDLRINQLDANENGAVFELKVDVERESGMGTVYPDGGVELPLVPILPVSLATIRLYFGDTLSVQYGSAGQITDTGIAVPEGEWARVILVTTPADTFSLYYDNEKLLDSVSTIYARDFSTDTDLLIKSEAATVGSDFDVKNYAVYNGDTAEELFVPKEDPEVPTPPVEPDPPVDPSLIVDTIDLSDKAVGLLTDTNLTNYNTWKASENASVSVVEENGKKYLKVLDNDTEIQPAIQRKDIDYTSGVKTIAFDMRINAFGEQYPVFEIHHNSSKSYVLIEFWESGIKYGKSGASTMLQLTECPVEDKWASVILVIDGDNNNYSFYYDGNKIITEATPRGTDGRSFSDQALDVDIRSNKANTGCDFDVRNYAVYSGNKAEELLDGYMSAPIEKVDLSDKEVGLLTDKTLTNYNGWKDSPSASVSIKEENGNKYINVLDNDATKQPGFQRQDIVFSEGIKTITFDIRINELGTGTLEIELYDVSKGTSWVRLEITKSQMYYYLTGNKSKTGAIPTMNKWVQVILVIDADTNCYSFYYGGKEILFDTPPRENRDFTAQPIDLQVRGKIASDSVDFDIRNYRIYSGNTAYMLMGKDDPNAYVDVDDAGTKGSANAPINTNLGLPYSDGYKWSTVTIEKTAYENYLAKRADLAAASLAAGGSADEVRVLKPVSVRGAVEVYVSPDGDDDNNGSKEQPLQTIRRALAFVAELEEAGAQGVLVYLRAGTYTTEKAININARHSGKNNIPVINSAYPNEEVIISGCITFSGSQFTAVTDEAVLNKLKDSIQDKVVAFDLKELGLTEFGSIRGYNAAGGPNYSVQINGENLTLARYPNADADLIPLSGTILDIGPITGKSSLGEVGTNSSSTGVEFEMVDTRPLSWENDGNIWFKGSLYAEWRIQNQRVAAINANSIKLEANLTGDAKVFNCGAITNKNSMHYYYNILEELDVPGEFYVDTSKGMLYLYPTCDLSDATITYTRATNTLMQIRNAQNIVINGLTLQNTAGVAVSMYNCNQVVVQNCIIQNVGQGVTISGEKSGVIRSEFRYVTGRSVYFTDRDISKNNFLQNCLFDPGANREKSQEVLVYGKGHVISHNLFQDTFNNSIHLTWATECIVEYNEIVGGPTGTQDGGSIYQYSAGDTYNNHIRFNYIHDTGLPFEGSSDPWAIYFDDASCGSFAYGNIIQNTQGGLFTNSGSEHVFADNIIVNGRTGTNSSINISDNFYNKSWADFTAYKTDYQTYLELYMTDENFRAELERQSPAMARRYKTVGEHLANGYDGTGDLCALNNYAVNNIMSNHEGIKEPNKYYTSLHKINNYQNKYDIFVDSKNGDFTLNGEYSFGNTVYIAPDMSKMGIVEYLHLSYEAFHNLRLQDLTKVGYAFKFATEETVEEYGVLIWTGVTEYEVSVNTVGVQKKALVLDKGYYTTESDGIYAQRLGVVQYAKPYIKVGDQYIYGDVDVYSPAQYAQTVLGGSDEKLKQLMIGMLNYGSYAQLYFAEANQETAPKVLINDVLTAEQKALNWSDALKVATPTVTKDTANTLAVTWYGTNLNLLEAVQMNMAATGNIAGMYYWTEDAYNSAETLNGASASGSTTIRVSNGYTIGGITGIVAQSIDDVFYVCCYDASGNLGAIRADSVAAYATRLIEKSTSTEATVNMAKALLVYGNSAMEYFSQSV